MINRESPMPIYHQLKQIIKQQIDDGDLEAGDKLPTERELCDFYNISRAPVRQALADLAKEGHIYRQAGLGTFVTEGRHIESIPFNLLANDKWWVSLAERTIALWNEQHPQRDIQLNVDMPAQPEFHQHLYTAVAQGQVPDMISLDCVWMMEYVRTAYLAPIDVLDPAWVAELAEELEPTVYESHFIDGHVFGVPMQTDVTGMWYRRDWFAAEGLTPPTTWDDLRALLAHFDRADIKAKFGHECPILFPSTNASGEATVNVLFPIILGAGGELLDEDGKLSLVDEKVYRALDFLQEITFQAKYMLPEAATYRWWDIPQALAKGRVPMTFGGTYEWPAIAEQSGWGHSEEALLSHLGFVPMPRPTADIPPVATLGGASWVLLRQSNLQGLGLELIKLALSSNLNTLFYEEKLQLSPFKSTNQQLSENHPWIREIMPLLAVARPRPKLAQYIRVSLFLQQMFEQILWQGAPAEKVVKQTASYLALLLGT